MDLNQALKAKWYSQGFNSTLVHLVSAAESCKVMEKELGFTYSYFLLLYKNNYGDYHYYVNDLDILGQKIITKLKKDKNFFVKIRKIYLCQMAESKVFFRKIDQINLAKISNNDLIGLINEGSKREAFAVGVAHVIEPFVLTTDVKIKQELSKYLNSPKELNQKFSLLMSPIKVSFVKSYEDNLKIIALEKNKAKKITLAKNLLKKYFWVRNSYAGKYNLTIGEILRESRSLINLKRTNFNEIIQQKRQLIKELKLPSSLVELVKITEFLTSFQDERKENALLAIDYLDRLLAVVAKRFKIDINYLRFSIPYELTLANFKSKDFRKQLVRRSKRCVYIYNQKNPIVLTGKPAQEFTKKFYQKKIAEVKEITGMTASVGTVVGHVKICTTLRSLKKIKSGDIIVASMTRPEYMPALRLVSAIITDEGGITCHAAIISRELGIPCIIGTKVATKVLKDGDLVEVKANHGLVIILKKK
ncbi:MAG: PEP-utilizing enzyme [Patescibacteria group bacterium]